MSTSQAHKVPEIQPASRSAEIPRILLLEDSPGEAELFCEALVLAWRSAGCGSEASRPGIEVRHTAQDALNSLRKRAESETGNLPELVVLDLDLHGRTSLTFLRELRQDRRLASLPVITMAWSGEQEMACTLNRLGVAGYFVKPLRFADLLIMVGDICRTWLPVDRRRELCLLNGEQNI